MHLENYLSKEGISKSKFGAVVGVSHAHIINIIQGKKSPSLILAKRIEEATKGAVTVYDLINPKVPSRYKVKKNEKEELSVMGG